MRRALLTLAITAAQRELLRATYPEDDMHYKNGREAKVGDPVVGETYNREGVVAGTVLSITPGADTCNCMIGLLETWQPDGRCLIRTPIMVSGDEQHGSAGELTVTQFVEDYSECGRLMHAEDAFQQ